MALVLLAALASGAAAQEKIDRRFPLTANGSVKIFNFVGSIRIVGWERDTVAVSGTVQQGARLFAGGGADGIKLGVEGAPGDAKSPGADLVIRVPATAQVWARGASTEIFVEGLIGSVDIGSVGGRVRVEGAPKELIAESMDGALEIIGSPGLLRAKTATGPLTWRGAGTEAMLSSVSGRISAEGGPIGYARIETVSGNVSVLAALRADANLVIESHSGSVELRVPRDVPTRLTADVAELSGAGIKPQVAIPSPKRAPPRRVEFNQPGEGKAAEIMVRSFKGALRIVPD